MVHGAFVKFNSGIGSTVAKHYVHDINFFVVKIFSLLTTKSIGKRKFYESCNFCDFSANVLKVYDIFQVFSCMTF